MGVFRFSYRTSSSRCIRWNVRGPVPHTPRDSRGKPIFITPAPASRVVALPKIITLTDNSMSNAERIRQLLCCAER